jgi:serine/threonine protein kinase/TolB-like protein/cytochrome c-type biogenesis protein CcmH/NrfG
MSGRNERIRELYESALKRPIGERAAFVATHARGDDDLERRVSALLAGQQDTQIVGFEATAGGDTPVLAIGTRIDHYRIDGPLGAGGMGVVYRATDTKLNRPAAIKVLPESLADPEARRRFQREAQMASSLNHPHIVTVYDAGEYQQRQYLITEYVDGGTLRQWAARPRGWLAIVELLIGVADAVAAAHEAGILHRDIKPENILLAKNGYAKLADFGLAKLLEVDTLADDPFGAMPAGGHSTLAGTVGYMSPEQAEGLQLDGRSDVYSFGLVLHELLTGVRPSATRLAFHEGQPEPFAPLPSDVPVELRTIVAKALERNPDDRYQTMHDLVVDLRRVVRRSGVEAQPSNPASSPFEPPPGAAATTMRPRRSRWRTGLLAAAAALVVLGSSLGAYYGLELGAPPRSAVAVLPFANESTADDLHISDGLGDDLRNRLMGITGLDVQARASSVSFREPGTPPQTIAASLGVSVLVNGVLRRRGNMLIVAIEAMDASGTALKTWAYQRPERELLALQQTIGAEVAAFLAPGSAPALPTATPSRESESANMLVLAGTRLEQQVTDELTVDADKLATAIDRYRRATEIDPNSVAAHARLARALIYYGEVNEASVALARAQTLSETNSATPAAELSNLFYTSALYLLQVRSNGIEQAYLRALQFNPNNTDALGAYAQWLMVHFRSAEADAYFQRALDHDRQLLSRYVDYAQYLTIVEQMDRAREIGEQIRTRFPNDRGYRALARLYENTGELDIAIAWGLRAYRENPANEETPLQLAELYARIGDFDTAAKLETDPPGVSLLWYRGDYERLADEAGILIVENQEPKLFQFYAFALNALNESRTAVTLLQDNNMVIEPGAEHMTGTLDEALTIYIDALQAVGGRDAEAQVLAQRKANAGIDTSLDRSWWVMSYYACTLLQLGREDEALDVLDNIRVSQGLAWMPVLRDSPCFRRVADEPRYQELLAYLEMRQAKLRERLPITLQQYEVTDVRPR